MSQVLASDSPQQEGIQVNINEQAKNCLNADTSYVAEIFYHPLDRDTRRATGAEACLHGRVVKKDEAGRFTPPGWKKGMDRGHLIGRQFGGSNTKPEKFVPLYPNVNQQQQMKNGAEQAVVDRLNRGERVYYFVRPMYGADAYVPERIEIYVRRNNSPDATYIINNK
ncbi:DNA/RNA non-specific endonuclease [Actinophytocola glycyrrhizae]|uniref:DNA/RNA non-specific endonuclease n=1 Tax=Actinophytocola glycyrrhizae TaxID=2044873 RepID=A0ABV9S6X2_9PSEU